MWMAIIIIIIIIIIINHHKSLSLIIIVHYHCIIIIIHHHHHRQQCRFCPVASQNSANPGPFISIWYDVISSQGPPVCCYWNHGRPQRDHQWAEGAFQTAIKQWKCEVFFVMFSYLSCYQIRLYLFQTLFGSYSCNVHESGDAMDLVWWGFGSCLICLCHPVVASSWLPSGTLVADIATENATENHHVSICFICSYWYGSIPINIFREITIH